MLKYLKFSSSMCLCLPILSLMYVDNLLILWIIMEVQLMFFLLSTWSSSGSNSKYMLFLLIQMLSSLFMLMAFFLLNFLSNLMILVSIVCFMLFMKSGFVPFHFWFLDFLKILKPLDYYMILSFMKLIPMLIFLQFPGKLSVLLVYFNLIMSPLLINFFNDFKILIFYSSITNTMFFLLMSMFTSFTFSFLFLFTYFLLLYFLMSIFTYESYNFIFGGLKSKNSLVYYIYMFSMVGIPYSVGFVMKSSIISTLYFLDFTFYTFLVFLINSILFSYFYMKMLLYMFLDMPMVGSTIVFLASKNNNLWRELMWLVTYPIMVVSLLMTVRFLIF